MEIELHFPALPYDAVHAIFPAAETLTSPDSAVTTGLIRSMQQLNETIVMEQSIPHGKGACKLVLPDTALVGRSILSFAPTWQLWSGTSEDGSLRTMITGLQRVSW